MNSYRLKHGRVTDIWTQFDGVGMMHQLGAIPEPDHRVNSQELLEAVRPTTAQHQTEGGQ
jgi:hypothetical protein